MDRQRAPAIAGQGQQRAALLLYLGPVCVFYLGFLLLPYLLMLRLSFFQFSPSKLYVAVFTTANYVAVLTDPYYLLLLARTMGLGLAVTILSLLLAYPLALKIVRSGPALRQVLLAVTLSPLLINLIVRSYAWLVILGDNGVVNRGLRALRLIDAPLPIGGNWFAVILGLLHIGLPLMVLSLIGVVERIEAVLPDAAASLGASPARVVRRIVLPLSLPGIASGSLLVFCATISSFVTPALLGGNRVATVSTVIYDKFTFSANWPVGAALVFCLLLATLAAVALHGRLLRSA